MTNSEIIIYCRHSKDDQSGRDVKAQLATCRQWCTQRGYTVAAEVVDDGVSGGTIFDERDGGARVLDLLGQETARRVVMDDLSRLSRHDDLGQQARDYNKLFKATGSVDNDERVHFVVMDISVQTPEGEMTVDMLRMFARYERRNTRRRFMKGIQAEVRKGTMYRASTPPYGYRYNSETRQLEVREDTAAIVKKIYDLYLTGCGHRAIVTKLMEANVPPPSEGTNRKNVHGWHVSRVRHILLSPVYKGAGVYRARDPNLINSTTTDDIEMTCPVIIDETTWDLVQRRHEERGVRWEGPRTKHPYLLSKILYCSDCGGHYSPYTARDKSYYRCTRRTLYSQSRGVVKLHKNKRWNWPTAKVDKVIKEFIRQFMGDPERLAPYLDAGLVEKQRAVEASLADVTKLEARLQELDAEERSLLRLKDKDQMVRLLDENATAKKAVTKELKAAKRTSLTAEDTKQALIDLRTELWELTARAKEMKAKHGAASVQVKWPEPNTEEEWRQLVVHLIDKVHITGSGSELDIRFEGVLHLELAKPSDVIGASRPQ